MYRSAQQPGTDLNLAIDRTGVVPDLEPDKVSLGRNLLLPLAVLMNAGLIFAVARFPLREPEPAIDPE